jgi:thiamine-monophosphate kinase
MISERECIDRILRHVQAQESESLIKGIGDDCAVIKKDGESVQLLTTDTLVEGVHFDLTWHQPYLLGRKCASVNLSDIAAMGGKPIGCLLSVGFPDSMPVWFDDFMAGFSAVLSTNDTMLIGGDTVKSRNDLLISVVITGEGKRDQICYRSGAKVGDLIWVSGSLGNAAAGLELCRKGVVQPEDKQGKWHQLVKAHLDPIPQIQLGLILASSGLVHAMMDISDGLATDLAHLCRESGVGAAIEEQSLPVDESLKEAALELDTQVLDWVLKGGEDYRLLFTTGAEGEQKLRQLIPDTTDGKIHCIGRITEGDGVYLCSGYNERQEITYQGYDHFSVK